MFNIEFLSKPTIQYEEPSMFGRITLGDFSEMFISPIVYWSAQDYQHQWQTAAARLIEGHGSTTFFTTMYDPETANFLQMWPMWSDGDHVRVQNHLLLFEHMTKPFDPSDPYLHVGQADHEAKPDDEEDHQPASEWIISLNDLRSFVNYTVLGDSDAIHRGFNPRLSDFDVPAIREAATVAFRSHDFAGAAMLYAQIEQVLRPSERSKFNYARKRASDGIT